MLLNLLVGIHLINIIHSFEMVGSLQADINITILDICRVCSVTKQF